VAIIILLLLLLLRRRKGKAEAQQPAAMQNAPEPGTGISQPNGESQDTPTSYKYP